MPDAATSTCSRSGAELERNLIIERVRAGMRRAKLEGIRIGRRPAQFDRDSVLRDRERGHSLSEIAKAHRISRALVSKVLKQAKSASHKGSEPALRNLNKTGGPTAAAEPIGRLDCYCGGGTNARSNSRATFFSSLDTGCYLI